MQETTERLTRRIQSAWLGRDWRLQPCDDWIEALRGGEDA